MGLERFVDAQRDVYSSALDEIRAGAKQSHWMWFIFPQIAGLGRSPTAVFYAIADLAEARAYLAHPLLRERLEACTDATLGWAGKRSADRIFGSIDAVKFRSSMTLFERASDGDARYGRSIEAFFAGERDPLTLRLLGTG